jgi:hypothetical protein
MDIGVVYQEVNTLTRVAGPGQVNVNDLSCFEPH